MTELINPILCTWVVVGVLMFWNFPSPRAAVACLVVGWLVLPTTQFEEVASSVDFPYWISGVAMPVGYAWTKATAIGLALLLGMALCCPRRVLEARWRWWDLICVFWCVWPIASACFNGLGIAIGMGQCVYLLFSWGAPYIAGRSLLSDRIGHQTLAWGIVLGTIAITPILLVESVIGPRVYEFIYGFHPFRYDGDERYFGYRPIGLLEHGNQLGMMLGIAVVVALGLALIRKSRGDGSRVERVCVAVAAVLCLMGQSVGAIALTIVAVVALILMPRIGTRAILLGLGSVLSIVAIVGLLWVTGILNKDRIKATRVGGAIAEILRAADRGSLGWRLKVAESGLPLNRQRAIVGWGRHDWWRAIDEKPSGETTRGGENPRGSRPWGWWQCVWGSYGLVGLALAVTLLCGPALACLLSRRDWQSNPIHTLDSALALAILIMLVDATMNSFVLPPIVSIAGALIRTSRSAEYGPDEIGPS